MNTFEKKISNEIKKITHENLCDYTPGLCLQVVQSGKLKANLRLGETYKYYDLASLTKIIFTVPAFMALYDEKRIGLNDHVSQILNWWPHSQTQLSQVLSHSARLPWWAPFYKKINLKSSVAIRREQVQKILSKTKLTRSKKSVYSDLDFILLGFVLEALHDASLLDVWQNVGWSENVPSLHFNVSNKLKYKKSLYAPTERCPWRKKILQGEVHDDNTWAFGGVSTHAGLFGQIEDVTKYGMILRDSLRGKNTDFVSPRTIKKFSRRAVSRAYGDWALGFMMPTRGSASCGQYFSPTSFGHTGFTGTSFWYDPKKDLQVVLLSNRVHPSRENKKFVELRPLIHDLIVKNI
ncbi:MAG: serine hydrolase [Bdellovibrionales bacterium]|nr:serine hydrolase [Bdellovibrionales bacterium]